MGLDAAILGMLNKLLNKPTGGVDWGSLTPVALQYPTQYTTLTENVETELISITGTGYLIGVRYFAREINTDRITKLLFRLYLDGTLVEEFDCLAEYAYWYTGSSTNSKGENPARKDMNMIFRFESEAKIVVYAEGDSLESVLGADMYVSLE